MNVKICPICETLNEEAASFCQKCGQDLFDIDPVDENQQGNCKSKDAEEEEVASKESPEKEAAPLARKLLKQCPACGNKYPFSRQKCPKDNTYLVMLRNFENKANSEVEGMNMERSVTLVAEDCPFELKLCGEGKRTIGREAEGAEYLGNKMYVGREHAVVLLQRNGVFIEHISKSNPTLVNGKAIERNMPFEIHNGDVIALGACEGQTAVTNAAYFKIRIDT